MTIAAFKSHAKTLLGPEAQLLEPYLPRHTGDVLYHISKNPNIKEFYPMVTNRTVENEDRRIPRICVSNSIAGCVSGYANVFEDLTEDEDWRGGYYIYALPFKVAAIPDASLLASVAETDEIWIVGQDEAHRSINAQVIGKIIPVRYSIENRGSDEKEVRLELAVQIYDRAAIPLDREATVGWGFHTFTLFKKASKEFYELHALNYRVIDEEYWRQIKSRCAGLLSMDIRPPSTRW